MTSRRFLLLAAALGLAACGGPPPPNIVFIMADDLGWGDPAVYGNELLLTPRLDALAAEGMRFTQVYSGGPVCGPARCVLMTGFHTGHCTRRDNLAEGADLTRLERLVPLTADDVTVAMLLEERGYATGWVGKWALGNLGSTGSSELKGFQESFGFIDQLRAHDHYTDHLFRNGERFDIPDNADGEGVYVPDLFVDEAVGFVTRHRDEPFFLYLALTLPHHAFKVPSPHPFDDREEWKTAFRAYAGMVHHVDAGVGRVLDALEALDLDERTIVFFTSDNGPVPVLRDFFDSTGGLKGGKEDLWEGGIRMPMLVRWPGRVPAGRVSDAVWGHVDFLPTAVELAGGKVPEGLDGRSVRSILEGDEPTGAPPYYWEFHRPFQQAVRLGDWKGLRWGTEEPLELYDLANDPGETTDVAAEHPDVVAEIEAVMAGSRTDSPHWTASKKREPSRRLDGRWSGGRTGATEPDEG